MNTSGAYVCVCASAYAALPGKPCAGIACTPGMLTPCVAAFVGLGDLPGGEVASYVSDVSASGEVVVGWSRNSYGDEAVRWTTSGGLVGLGGGGSQAHAVSPDGTLSTGSVLQDNGVSSTSAAVWRGLAPPELLPAFMPLAIFPADGTVVLDDGHIYATCYQSGGHGAAIGCRLDPPASLVPNQLSLSKVFAADASAYGGTRLVGPREPPTYDSVAIWNGTRLGYPVGAACLEPHHCGSEVRDFSADHSIVVGTSRVPAADQTIPPADPTLFDTAFIYTMAAGMRRLDDLLGGVAASGAYAISASGHLIAGFGTDWNRQTAVVWLDGVPKALDELVVQMSGVIPAGWKLSEVRAVSADGRTLVGNGTNPMGQPEGFRVVLPSASLQP